MSKYLHHSTRTALPEAAINTMRYVLDFISKGVWNIKGFNKFSSAHIFLARLHSSVFFILLITAVIFFSDMVFLEGALTTAAIERMGINPGYEKYIESGHMKLFYVAAFFVALPISIISAFFFYLLRGHSVDRAEVLFLQQRNEVVASILEILRNALGVMLAFVAGYFFFVAIPGRLGLDAYPIFGIFQIIVIVKWQTIISVPLAQSTLLLLPYKFHPRRFSIFRERR